MEHPLVNDLMAQFGGFPNPVDRMIPTILLKYPTFIKIDKKFNLSRECKNLEAQVTARLQSAYSAGGFIQRYVDEFLAYNKQMRIFMIYSTLIAGLAKCLALKRSSSPTFYTEIQRLCTLLIIMKYYFNTKMNGGRRTRKYKR